jgi:hypothetical protein
LTDNLEPRALVPQVWSYSWHNGVLRERAEARATAALKAWDLRARFPDMGEQAKLQLAELCRLLLQDYLESQGCRVTRGGLSGDTFSLQTATVPLPVTILTLRRILRAFPLPQVFDFLTVEKEARVLVVGHTSYLGFPFTGETWFISIP